MEKSKKRPCWTTAFTGFVPVCVSLCVCVCVCVCASNRAHGHTSASIHTWAFVSSSDGLAYMERIFLLYLYFPLYCSLSAEAFLSLYVFLSKLFKVANSFISPLPQLPMPYLFEKLWLSAGRGLCCMNSEQFPCLLYVINSHLLLI